MTPEPPEHLRDFAERVRALVAPFGSVAKAAKALGIAENTLRRACAGRNEPQAPLLIALSTKLDVSMSYLLGLSDEPEAPARAKAGPEFLRLPALDAASAESLPFPAWMTRRLAPAGANLGYLRAPDDAMRPLFGAGALLLIDCNDRRPAAAQAEAIYMLTQAGTPRARRLRPRAGGGWFAICDNPEFDPEILRASELNGKAVIGRVVWWDDRL